MNSTRATIAIIRHQVDQRTVIGCAVLMATGFFAGDHYPQWKWALYFFIAFGGAALYVAITDFSYFIVPMYGRQIARAHAVSTIVASVFPLAALFYGMSVTGASPSGTLVAVSMAAAIVSGLVGLSLKLRRGRARLIYALGMACAGLSVAGLNAAGVPWYGTLAFATLLGFFALRAFGETLARYDPIPD